MARGGRPPESCRDSCRVARKKAPAATAGARAATLSALRTNPGAGGPTMPRRKKKPEPFFRNHDGWWYVQLGKDQVKLARGRDNQDAAWRAYFRVMADRAPASPAAPLRDPTVTAVCNLFLDFSRQAHKPRTYEFYR